MGREVLRHWLTGNAGLTRAAREVRVARALERCHARRWRRISYARSGMTRAERNESTPQHRLHGTASHVRSSRLRALMRLTASRAARTAWWHTSGWSCSAAACGSGCAVRPGAAGAQDTPDSGSQNVSAETFSDSEALHRPASAGEPARAESSWRRGQDFRPDRTRSWCSDARLPARCGRCELTGLNAAETRELACDASVVGSSRTEATAGCGPEDPHDPADPPADGWCASRCFNASGRAPCQHWAEGAPGSPTS